MRLQSHSLISSYVSNWFSRLGSFVLTVTLAYVNLLIRALCADSYCRSVAFLWEGIALTNVNPLSDRQLGIIYHHGVQKGNGLDWFGYRTANIQYWLSSSNNDHSKMEMSRPTGINWLSLAAKDVHRDSGTHWVDCIRRLCGRQEN